MFFYLRRKIHILLEKIFGKTKFILIVLYYRFFMQQFIGNAFMQSNAQIDMNLFCRHRILTRNTWQQTRHFNLDFDIIGLLFPFLIFQRSTFDLEKRNKSICHGKCLVHPKQVARFTYFEIIFQTMNASKICT